MRAIRPALASLFLTAALGLPGCRFSAPQLRPLPEEGWAAVLAANRGRVLVINLWASWCPACLQLMPSLAAMDERYQDRGVVFVGGYLPGDPTEDLGAARMFLADMGTEFPHYFAGPDPEETAIVNA